MFNVHGLDPATTPTTPEVFGSWCAPSEPAEALPLGATTPALCGTLVAAQMGAMPSGGAGTGAVVEQSSNDAGLMALGGGLALVAAVGGTVLVRRRIAQP